MLNLLLPTIETERLIIRPIRIEDAVDMYAYASDAENTRFVWFDLHKSLEDSQKVIQELFLSRVSRGIPEAYVLELKSNHQMIGTCDVHTVRFNDVGELGYIINKQYWNQGYTTEAILAIIPVLFHHCGFRRLEIQHDILNIASQRIVEKAGFIYEGTYRQRKIEKDGSIASFHFYGLLNDDPIVYERYWWNDYRL
ncbi:MAG: GNAT family N-acetyltransferase [Erysipelotrichaceae bacterium]